jgi:hypothetical protein
MGVLVVKIKWTRGRVASGGSAFFDSMMLGLYCLVAAIVILLGVVQSHAQQTTIYGPNGAVVGREVRSRNSTTVYGPSGSVIGRSSTDSSGTTTYYGPDGRVTGRSTRHGR